MKRSYKILMTVAVLSLFVLMFLVYGENVKIEKVTGKAIGSSGGNAAVDAFLERVNNDEMIKDMPMSALVEVEFYAVDQNGEWVAKKNYYTSEGKLKAGKLEKADAKIYVHEKYMTKEGNFCDLMKEAKKNNEMVISSEMSAIKAAFKYSMLLKYKKCVEV